MVLKAIPAKIWALITRFVASRYAFHVVVGLLIFVPHTFGSFHSEPPMHFGLPRIAWGDEPHYLVFLNSILKDHDLDLSNNYASVHQGSQQAGLIHAYAPLDHHSVWFRNGERKHWFVVFEMEPDKWSRDANGHVQPTPRPETDPADLPTVESPWNAPGLPLLLSVPLFWAGNTPYLESLVTICSGLAVLLASMFWRMLAQSLTTNRTAINLGIALTFLGTPAWHYGRSFFSEPYLFCAVLGVFAFAIVKERWAVSGFLMGMAIFIKPLEAVIGLPLGIYLLWKRRFRDAALFALPVILWIGAVAITNKIVFGGYTTSSNTWISGNAFYNAILILLHPNRGLAATAPVVFVAAAGWPWLFRRHPLFVAAFGGCIVMFLTAAANRAWGGGMAYSIRFVIPVLPLFCLGLVRILDTKVGTATAKWAVGSVAAASMFVSGCAAVQYWNAFARHPLEYILPMSDK